MQCLFLIYLISSTNGTLTAKTCFRGKESQNGTKGLSGKLIVSVAVVSMHSPLSLLLIVSGFENPDYGRDLHMQINITSRESFPPEIWKS